MVSSPVRPFLVSLPEVRVVEVASFPLVAANTSALVQDIHRADFWLELGGVASQVVPGSDFTIGEAIGP